MIVTTTNNTNNMQRRNNDGGFSTKAVALKLVLSAAAIGTVTNLWLLQSYSKDDIYLTHHDVDDEVQPEWEPILDYNSPSSDKATEPSIDDKRVLHKSGGVETSSLGRCHRHSHEPLVITKLL